MIDLAGKEYLVAGLSSPDGIAAGIAGRLLDCGASVYCTAIDEDQKALACESFPRLDPARVFIANFKFEDSLSGLLRNISEKGISFDGAVNATGYADPGEMEEPLRESSWEAMAEAHAINVIGTRHFFAGLIRNFRNNASMLVLTYHPGAAFAIPGYHLMGIQKAALESLMRYLALDFGELGRGLRINALSPGILPTRSARAVSGFARGTRYEALLSPQKRNLQMEEAANEAVWLLSPFSSGTNGQVRVVDTGFLANALNPGILDV